MSIQVEKKYFNVTEYYLMAEAGILSEDDRVELIEGEILKMSPIGSPHAACVDRTNRLLARLAGHMSIVRVQNPIRLSNYTEPQPDVSLLKLRDDFYAKGHPSPADVLLVVEVADTSLGYDKHVKVPLYAQADIPEVWVVNLSEDVIEVYTESVNGSYQQVRMMKRGESFTLGAISDIIVNVDAVLG
jgi:Uma2 family endonuclease